MLFTVEIKGAEKLDQCEVELYLDHEALSDLLKQLSFLKLDGDHAHFFTPSGGGNPLAESAHLPGNILVNHLRIELIPKPGSSHGHGGP